MELPRGEPLPNLISPPATKPPRRRMWAMWANISDLHWTAFLVSSLVLAAAVVALAVTLRPLPPPPAVPLLAQIDLPPFKKEAEVTVQVDTSLKSSNVVTRSVSEKNEKQADPSLTLPDPSLTLRATAPAPEPSVVPAKEPERPKLDPSGRTHRQNKKLLIEHGGSPESEQAVERGLRWLLAHQSRDGSWRFDLTGSSCSGSTRCRNPGTEPTTTGATGLALLAFLGAGYTQQNGEYQQQIIDAFYYLRTKARTSGRGVDLTENANRGMYGHGIATIALCEAYALTQDDSLKDLAQRAVNFIVDAQDNEGGGWRYVPRVPGDVTVTGWQVMALKCAEMAKLTVSSPSFVMANHFLDTVQTDQGAQYAYMPSEFKVSHATTAIGLLTRMYLGWQINDARLTRGVNLLSSWGPLQGDSPEDMSQTNMYYNYYTTQVMHHWGSVHWLQWNAVMRDFLIKTQAKAPAEDEEDKLQKQHETGSWHFDGGYGNLGGRLYNTAMAIMTLEVYYRYMPIYRAEAVRQ